MSKETLKPNEVMAPTLFVGVGGTGSDIVTRVANRCRPEERENMNFVCLDTNANDLSVVKKCKARVYAIQTSNTQTVGDYLDYDEEARKFWFPKNAVMYDKTVSEGAGQVRAISRLALNSTIKTGNINPLYDAIDDLFRKNGTELKQAIRIVLVSTASGGTGSGIILPMSMYIRDYIKNKYPNTAPIIRAMIILPEALDSVIKSTTERESQRRNAYATVKEINAFMMKGSGFLKIDPDLQRYEDLHVDVTVAGSEGTKSLGSLPMDFCFLMDGQDSEDSTMISFEKYKEQAAVALYEQNVGPMMKYAFSVEDNIIKEMSSPNNLGRNRFGGIGASVLRYPHEEIAEYVAYGWALSNIAGDGEEVSRWGKYDKEYEIEHAEDVNQNGLSESEACQIEDVFPRALDDDESSFAKDLKNTFGLDSAEERSDDYVKALTEHVLKAVQGNSAINAALGVVKSRRLNAIIDYTNKDNQGRGVDNLNAMRVLDQQVQANAEGRAKTAAAAVFRNEKPTEKEDNAYMIETFLKNDKKIAHPIAARYLLYTLMKKLRDEKDAAAGQVKSAKKSLANYAQGAMSENLFDLEATKGVESSFDDLVGSEKDKLTRAENRADYAGKLYEKFNTCFTTYYRLIDTLMKATAKEQACVAAYKAVNEYLDMYKKFFKSFDEKVKVLLRNQEDLIDSLRFEKGDSYLNVCTSKAVLDELLRSTAKEQEAGAMLEDKLNGEIFDAVKGNVMFERENQNMDVIENDKRKDIFDDIILGYFVRKVTDEVESLDVNIIEGIALEAKMADRHRQREENAQKDDKAVKEIKDSMTNDEYADYIKKKIERAYRLAAPGVQRLRNVEPREINIAAYNVNLSDMRRFRIGELFPKGGQSIATWTVSKYELRFFNALYNLTPDQLNKFACPDQTETRVKNAGLYFNAYQSYSKSLGPDSTKNTNISTHIDKRWDSIAAMPELDFGYMKRQMMKIHQALILGLVYGVIQRKPLSVLRKVKQKMVYRYENSDERQQVLTVSNGTLCDEFYEILDALYIDAAVVEDIGVICHKREARDIVRNSNYDGTTFAKQVEDFSLGQFHEGKASLLEIPLAYYASLPNSQRYTGEILALIDAVVKTLNDELMKWEREEDAKVLLCQELTEQFELLVENYGKYKQFENVDIKDNSVVDSIYRRVKNAMAEMPEPDDYEETIQHMKALINGTANE